MKIQEHHQLTSTSDESIKQRVICSQYCGIVEVRHTLQLIRFVPLSWKLWFQGYDNNHQKGLFLLVSSDYPLCQNCHHLVFNCPCNCINI